MTSAKLWACLTPVNGTRLSNIWRQTEYMLICLSPATIIVFNRKALKKFGGFGGAANGINQGRLKNTLLGIHKKIRKMESVNKILTQITERLMEEFKPERIFLFGSHAWGIPGKNSDLDLLVIVEESDLSPNKRASIAYRCLRDVPYPLDILVKTRKEVEKYSKVPAALEYKIINQGKLLYG